MSDGQVWTERSPYDPRENQIPVYLTAAASSIFASHYCSEKVLRIGTFRRRIPLVGLGAAISTAGAYAVWQQVVLRPGRRQEYKTWRSCPDCDTYRGFAAAFLCCGYLPLAIGGTITTAFHTAGTDRKLPRYGSSTVFKMLNLFMVSHMAVRVAFAAGIFGFMFAKMKIDHEKAMFIKVHPEGDIAVRRRNRLPREGI